MRIRKLAPKVLQLLTEWTETFPYDFRDERMMRSLKELTQRLSTGDEVSVPLKKAHWFRYNQPEHEPLFRILPYDTKSRQSVSYCELWKSGKLRRSQHVGWSKSHNLGEGKDFSSSKAVCRVWQEKKGEESSIVQPLLSPPVLLNMLHLNSSIRADLNVTALAFLS